MTQSLIGPMIDSLGIYVQVPFCASKCSFCNFSSQVARTGAYKPYVRAVVRETSLVSQRLLREDLASNLAQLPVDTIYFGGGTPTLLGSTNLGAIFGALGQAFKLDRVRESTIELTPASADDALLDGLVRLGVNRLSIGAQSFEDRELCSVGRLHSASDTVEQVAAARRAGFRRLSLDVIAGLPYQTMKSWQRSLQALARLDPGHVSVYLFEADENSRLGRQVLRHGSLDHAAALPDEDFMCRAYETACEFLAKEGYVHYEISNFARPGCESIHNRKYWQRRPYLGLGAGAHSFDGERRWANETAPEVYQRRVESGELPVREKRLLPPHEHMEEFFFLGLRERQGVSLETARVRWGKPPFDQWVQTAGRLQADGFVTQQDGRLRLTERAWLISNEIFEQFLSQ